MRRKKIQWKKIILLISIPTLIILFFTLKDSFADTTTYEIMNFEELLEAAKLSGQSGHQKDTFILKSDIEITPENQEILNNSEQKYISFGSSDYPFQGTFDGEGHTIYNLKYESTLDQKADTGLFSYTSNGAIIKNLTISNAEIQADFRGGIIAGYSEGTLFENITIKDSHLLVAATNNVLTIITDGGLRGGAIVGEAKNCVLYNCESNNTRVNTNNTSGVAALSGKGLFLGGLVGTSVSTEIEYSRVEGGLVKNYYDVAVGALGGNVLYVGGIVGQMKENSRLIDSYSTAELNFYCATYVSVGAGNTGHIGGISGAMFGDENEILRCHYAGKATSTQYNAVLVIPIIQNNVNISGITNVYEGGIVENTYFKPSLNPDVQMGVLGSDTSTDLYGGISDEQYTDKKFWKSENYDFIGNLNRDTAYNSNHTNKWIIDYERGIPIHGISISATLDFKNAGKVTIESTGLVNTEVSTENPYIFAVQGLRKNETQVSINTSENEGYRFVSWYKANNINVDSIEENHDFFENIFNQYEPISNEKNLENISIINNDLFVAYYQARVLFHNIDGNLIDKDTGEQINEFNEKDWYDYNDKLNCVEPIIRPESESAKLIGWTSIKSKESGGGYSSITNAELTNLKNSNAFYVNGDNIISAMNLYPVYVDSIYNITTVFEGNEQDSLDDVSLRQGVGHTTVKLDENKDAVISVVGENEDATFPQGYKFIGWFDENNMKVSTDQTFKLENIDLTLQHTFTAKFEYLVEYYVRAFGQNNGNAFNESELYALKYETYNSDFHNIAGPGFIKEYITHWGLEHVDHGRNDNDADAFEGKIVAPVKVYSHNYIDNIGGEVLYQAFITTDFPGSGTINDEHAIARGAFRFTPVNDRYHLQFWTLEKNDNSWTYINNPMKTEILDPSIEYKGMAMVTADIIFHKKDLTDKVVTRRYNSQIFLSEDTSYTYKYPFMHTDTEVSTNPADGDKGELNKTITLQSSPSNLEMQINGYAFLGWISSLDVKKDSEEWNYIYNVENDLYCTSDVSRAEPYLVSAQDTVIESIDLYPVYVKYNIETTTNINLIPSTNVNMPTNPEYEIIEDQEKPGIATVILQPDLDTFVVGDSGEKYTLISLVKINEDNSEEIIELDENNTYKYTIKAGEKYVFMAKYKPNILIYHLNNVDVKVEIRNDGESIGIMPSPTYNIEEALEDYIFYGWTNEIPLNGQYHKVDEVSNLDDINIIDSDYIINNSMEFWPVYLKLKIKVNSNIDDVLKTQGIDLNNVRYITKPKVDKIQLNAENFENYQFIGWYTNYVDDENKGQLIAKNNNYLLRNNESQQEQTYTAVYVKVYKVNYFNTRGEIIYSASINENEDRTFVNEILDEDGNKIMVPIDYEAYQNIYESLELNQIFINWQWQESDDNVVQWDDFYDKNINQDMNLFPIIRNISVIDSDKNNLDVIGSGDKKPDVVIGTDGTKIYAYFNITYTKPSLTVHVEDIYYENDGNTIIKYPKGFEVDFYKNSDITVNTYASALTDENGDAVINFFGEITISVKSGESNNDSFVFQVIDEEENLVTEILLSQGETKTIKVPYGNYKISEKDNWSWRYLSILYDVTSINNNNNKAELTFEETRGITKWFDAMTLVDNEYKE